MPSSRPPARASDRRDPAAAAAKRVFDAHIRMNRKLESATELGTALPADSAVLLALQAICMSEARRTLEAGHHTESRRLGNLARQLRKLAESAC